MDVAACPFGAPPIVKAIQQASHSHAPQDFQTYLDMVKDQPPTAIRDLLAVDVGDVATLLPADESAFGFDNIADALKLITKEIILPTVANKGLFYLGPIMTIMPSLVAWAVIPFGPEVAVANVNAGLLFLMAITSMEVYGVIIAGWASNSKFPFLGGIRASAQLISYELSMTLSVVPVFLWINAPGQPGTLSLNAYQSGIALVPILGEAYGKDRVAYHLTADYTWGWTQEESMRQATEAMGCNRVSSAAAMIFTRQGSLGSPATTPSSTWATWRTSPCRPSRRARRGR